VSEKEKYYYPKGGLSSQRDIASNRAIFKNSYALIPRTVMQDIVVSYFPEWEKTRAWVLARPMTGFSETFSQSIFEVYPDGGSKKPEPDDRIESIIFVVDGAVEIILDTKIHLLVAGSYVYIPPKFHWEIKNKTQFSARFHWIRKIYNLVEGIEVPEPFVKNEKDIEPDPISKSDDVWSTTRFVDPFDLRHDMHVNIVNIKPGGAIPFMETHVMEHGIYILQGKGVYRLNSDWVEVEAGDFIWLRAFCPQSCYAGGPEVFRYLLYKDVNRQIAF